MEKITIVLGLGKSGLAAAEFLLQQNKGVLGIDGNLALLKTSPEVRRLQALGLFVQPESDPIEWTRVEQLVVSPGISPNHPIYAAAVKEAVTVNGEAEIALPHFTKPLVAVTGTNGKTTVALLVEHILNASGVRAKALGNVGSALCKYLIEPGTEEAFVVELSSYQLETLRTPVFKAAVLLNITPDHLDRYDGMEAYAAAKCRLQDLMLPAAEFFVQDRAAADYGYLLTKMNYQRFNPDAVVEADQVHKIESILSFIDKALHEPMGRHDRENVIAAWVLCRPFSISMEQFCRALATFQKPPHRIQFVKEIEGVSYFDDSKGTNLDAVLQAVMVMKGPVILIAGGVDKGASYLFWKDRLQGRVKQIIAIGEAAGQIYNELHPHFTIKLADSLSSAVDAAAACAKSGDSVLLSPGCSSFDMFRDYAHRGEEFQRIVQTLEARRGS